MITWCSVLVFAAILSLGQAIGDCPDVECTNCARLLLDNVTDADFLDGFKLGELAKPFESVCFDEALWFNATVESRVDQLLDEKVGETIGRFRCADPSKMCLLSPAGRTGTEQYYLNTGVEYIHLVPYCLGSHCSVKGVIQLMEGADNSEDTAGLIKFGSKDDIRRYSWQFKNRQFYEIYDSAFLPIDVISCNGCPLETESYCMEPRD